MTEHNTQPSAATPIPTRSLAGSSFNFIETGGRDVESADFVPLWTAVRPGEVWKIWWNGQKSELELRFNETTLWASQVYPLPGRLRDLPAYRQIVDQFTGSPQAGAAGSSMLDRARKALI